MFIFILSQDGDLKIRDFHCSPLRDSASCSGVAFAFLKLRHRWRWLDSCPGRFTSRGKRYPLINCIRGWVDCSTVLHEVERRKYCPYRESNSIQPVASHYTDALCRLLSGCGGEEKNLRHFGEYNPDFCNHPSLTLGTILTNVSRGHCI
jgi:hypothetical protein